MTSRTTVLWAVGFVAAAALLATLTIVATESPVLIFGGLAALAIVVTTAMRPMAGVGIWLFVLVAIPNWTSTGTGLAPIALVGPLVLVGMLVSRRRERTGFAWPDFALAGAVVLLAMWTLFDSYPLVLFTNLVAMSFLAYLLGRVAPAAATRAYVTAMVATAVWGMLEYGLQLHVWENWMPSTTHNWNLIQGRAGGSRSEASFGHAIAYGAAIAMAIPHAFELNRYRTIVLVVLFGGVVVSLSRGPIITAAFTFALVVLFYLRGRRRIAGLLGLGVAAVGLLFVMDFLYGAEDSSTTAQSGDQRRIQLLATLPHIRWFGAETITVEDGRLATAGADIIDNTFLRLGVNFGWVMVVLIVAPLLYAVVNMLRFRVTPSSIALVGQIPVMFVTTLITQWQTAHYFIAGIAVSGLIAVARERRTGQPVPETARMRGVYGVKG